MFSEIAIPVGILLQVRGWTWAHAEQFDGPEAYWLAEARAISLGLTTGSMQSPAPTACFRDADYVAKWRGLSDRERSRMDGVVLTDGRGEGRRCWLLLREVPNA